jgi:ADP-ribose pyrophosphatase
MTDDVALRETLQITQEAFAGRLVRVTVDTVTLPNGEPARREVVHHGGAVAAVPLDEAGTVYLVRQWRHAAGRALLEIPAGTLGAGEDPEDCVRRELAEEIGRVPERLDHLTTMFVAPGYGTEVIHLYLARSLRAESLPADEDETVQVVLMGLPEALEACRDGRIRDGKSIAGLFLAREVLRAEGT